MIKKNKKNVQAQFHTLARTHTSAHKFFISWNCDETQKHSWFVFGKKKRKTLIREPSTLPWRRARMCTHLPLKENSSAKHDKTCYFILHARCKKPRWVRKATKTGGEKVVTCFPAHRCDCFSRGAVPIRGRPHDKRCYWVSLAVLLSTQCF